jgi:hypothetical protein
MDEEDFQTNLMRAIAAQLWVALSLQGAEAMFGKGYAALSVAEQAAADQWIFGLVAARYQATTPESLQAQKAPQPVGFQAPAISPTSES